MSIRTRSGRAGHPRLGVLVALLAPVGLVGGWTAAAGLQPGGYDATTETISALAADATPHRWVMTAGLALAALGHVLTAYAVPHLPRAGRLLLALGGVATGLVALVPLPSRTEGSPAHTLVAALALGLLAAWPAAPARGDTPLPPALRPAVARTATAFLLALLAAFAVVLVRGGPALGLVERVLVGAESLWPLAVAASAWSAAGRPVGRARGALLLVPVLLAALVGGAAATALAPTVVETRYYRAEVSLGLDPRTSGHLRVPTALGTIDLGFAGLAPGIVARPEVRTSITDVLAGGVSGLDRLQPSAAEVDDAVRAAVPALVLRFLVGAFAGALLLASLERVVLPGGRRRDPGSARLRRLVLPAAGAALVAGAVTAVAVQQTYRPERQDTFTTTGLIGVVAENANLLGEVEARATQVSPYLRNLLALTDALKQRYRAGPEVAVAARVLLVSDIHDGNAYALMRQVVEAEHIDLVVDAGDIVDFGLPAELDAAGIPRGIASLGVPYLFVKGNHDATGPSDRAVQDRLARVPNVVLLQPDPDHYTEVDLGGLRLAGFDDPRWYGDSGVGTHTAQEPARDAFVASFADREAPDLLVSHHPAAVRGLPRAAVVVNGHMHAADLEGNRIQVGTFTGGGPFSHYTTGAKGEELLGQPSAFDIATFGTDCRLASLTRYTFRNVVEGRPAYDDVTLLNGTRVVGDPAPDAPARTCTPAATVTTTEVPRVVPAPASTTSGTSSSLTP